MVHPVWLLVPALVSAATIRTDFEGASLGRVEKLSGTHFRLGVKGEVDQDGRNRQASWYCFEVDGASKTELTFDIVDLAGEYNYKPNRGAINQLTPPVVSYDGKTWKHLDNVEYDAAEPRLRLLIKPEGKRFRVAHTPPYTNDDLKKLRLFARSHGDFQEQVIGKSPGKRDLLLWTIHEGNSAGEKTVWLMFRQHSWESGSSWVGEGAVRSLLADTPEAVKLRRDIRWKILPLADPDGIARGGVRFNSKGFDLNRNWDVVDPVSMPEITAQRNAIRGQPVDLFLSLHNTETSEYLEGPPEGSRPLAKNFFRALSDTTFAPSRALFFAGTKADRGRMNVVQGLYQDFRTSAFLMEQRIAFNQKLGRLPTIEDRLRFGGELVRAVAAAVTQ